MIVSYKKFIIEVIDVKQALNQADKETDCALEIANQAKK